MPDTIGNISVPEVSVVGTFPLQRSWPFVATITPEVATHRFGAGNAKREQRYLLGNGARRWQFSAEITEDEWDTFLTFWEGHEAANIPFVFYAPNADQSFTPWNAVFENEPIGVDHQTGHRASVSVRLREVNLGAGPTYTLNSTQTRFPSGSLATALTAQAQEIIPLVKIIPRKAGYPAIYLSDRRCTVGAQLYQARLLNIPEIRQTAVGVPGAAGETDDTTFVFGNADRVMRDLAEDVMLDFARVEFSLFHVGTGIKLDLWAGEIQHEGWEVNGIEFQIRCSDLLANPFLIFPNRTADRVCNAGFDKAPLCPYTAQGALDLTNFPAADASFCDHGYATPNGCLAHGMAAYHRGVPIAPQAFRSTDDRGWFKRAGRNSFVSMSQVSDTIIGKPLPYIFTDVDMPVQAMLVAGVDQGDFYDAVGIVGQGPIGTFGDARKHTLDGQPQHDVKFPPRTVSGSEPAGATDYLSITYNGNQVNGDFRKAYVGNSTFIKNLSAGLAFVNIRRTDEKGEQFTRLDTHQMEVIVSQGLSGWKWTAPGTRTSVLLTNPVWVAINVYLWGLSLHEASAATQEQYFDCAAAIAAAAICDASATKLVGSGSETQFKFTGIIADPRPLRDWIQDILKNCLGYYTFAFGKLRIGIRSDSSAVAAFTSGNLLFKSVNAGPPGRRFNRYVASFADQVLDTITGKTEFLTNTATAYDEDFALELGGGDRAVYFQAGTTLPATSSISQAQRIANVSTREEIGGVDETERKTHRRIKGSTTILGLDFSAGEVISVADAEVPGGAVELRPASWRMGSDYKIDFEGNTTRDSMYDLVAGVKPADVLADDIPPEEQPYPFRTQWQPNGEVPISGDPIYAANHNSFALQQRYVAKGDSGKQALLDITGVQPVTEFLADTYPPIVRTATQATTGGSLAGGRVYFLSVCAFNGDGVSPPCKLRAISVPAGTNTNKITLSDIEWPAPPSGGSWDGYALFAAIDDERTSCNQAYVTAALPSSIVFSTQKISTWGMPSPTPKRVVVMGKQIEHFGVFGEQVTAVALNKVTIAALATLTDNYTGRMLGVVADQSDGSANLRFFTITAHNLTTGELTLTPDPLGGGIGIGDLATVLLEPNIYTGATIGDAKFVNDIYPGGLVEVAVNEEVGLLVRGITPSRPHQLRRVVANTADTYTVDTPFDEEPLYFIVEEAAWRYRAESSDIHNYLPDAEVTIPMVVDNLLRQPMLVGAFIEDRTGKLTPEELAVIRFTYLYGETGTSAAVDDGFYEAPIVSDQVEIDLANGLNQRIVLDQAARVTILDPIFTGGVIKPGSWLSLYIEQDATGSRPSPLFDAAYGADVAALQVEDTPGTRTALSITYDGSKWRVDTFHTGLAI